MITETQQIVMDLLGQTLFSVPFDSENYNRIDWAAVLKEARRQTVIPTAAEAVPKSAPEEIRLEWIREVYDYEADGYRVRLGHRIIDKILSENFIPYVILKGAASGMYYPAMYQRCYGDVDFLIPPERKEEAIALLEKEGFIRGKELPYEIDLQKDGIDYDLHIAVNGIPDGECGNSVRHCLSDTLQTAQEYCLDGEVIKVPDEFHHGMVLLLHTAAHMTGFGAGLRQLCDWAAFVSHMGERFGEIFEKELRAAGLWRFAQVMTASCTRYLHMESCSWALEAENETRLTEEFMEELLRKGGLAHDGNDDMDSVLIRNPDDGEIGSGGFLVQGIHNLASKVKYQWPITNKYGFLVPFGINLMCIRYFYGVLLGKYKKVNLKDTFAKAGKRRQFYDELGLFRNSGK